ncbi:Glutathione S-transferase theta-1 [Trebouxia sp. C0010 RCD-2024]
MATLYMNFMSQPARACVLFCRINCLKVEECHINVTAGQTRSQDFRKINPLGKIPCLKVGDFVLSESAAIMRYLAQVNQVPAHWYPRDPQERARVNSALDWYHGSLRLPAIMLTWYVIGQTMQPTIKLISVTEGSAKRQLAVLKDTLKMMEGFYLADRKFVAGDKISIADLLYSCELDEMQLLDGVEQLPMFGNLLEPFPKVRAWMIRVAETTEPHWTAVTATLQKVVKHGRERRQQMLISKL